MEYFDEKKLPMPFCPGCSHTMVMKALEAALKKLKADPKKTVLVSDIGCLGIADKYFKTHTLHGLHGRSFTYASGIKIANPELNVFVVVGDGGCGIGGHHLINAARRNVGITVICFDNFNFGMTGGEHSVTTPLGSQTTTTKGGNIEKPFDLCKLVEAAGGTFVARKSAFDKDLAETIVKAMKHNGFAFVDIMEICTAYYSIMNRFKKSDLDAYLKSEGLKTGVLKKERRPEYGSLLRAQMGKEKVADEKVIKAKFSPRFKEKRYNLLIAGSAGMKIVSAAGNFCRAGILSGLWTAQRDDYPVTVQTGHSLSTVSLSKERIDYLGSKSSQAVLIVSKDGLKKVKDSLAGLSKGACVIIDKKLGGIKTPAEVFKIDLSHTGLSSAGKVVAALSYFLKKRSVIDPEAYRSALKMISNEKIRRENIKAFETRMSSRGTK